MTDGDGPIIRKGARVTTESITGGRLTAMITKSLSSTYPLRRSRFFAGDAGFCSRASALFCLVSKEFEGQGSAASSFYFANGNSSHDVIADGFDKAGVLVCSEFHLPDVGMNLGGRIDNVIEVDGGYALVEIKTCGTLPTKPKPQNLAQAMVYSLITGIDRIFLFYISRSVASFDGRLKSAEFEIVPSQEDLESTAYRMCVAYFSTLAKKCPPIPPHITARSHCGFCPFQTKCWDGSEFAGVEDMTAKEFEKVHTTALEHSQRLIRTRSARRIQSVAEFDRMVVKRDEESGAKTEGA